MVTAPRLGSAKDNVLVFLFYTTYIISHNTFSLNNININVNFNNPFITKYLFVLLHTNTFMGQRVTKANLFRYSKRLFIWWKTPRLTGIKKRTKIPPILWNSYNFNIVFICQINYPAWVRSRLLTTGISVRWDKNSPYEHKQFCYAIRLRGVTSRHFFF